MKLSKPLLVGAIALATANVAVAADKSDYEIFNQQFLDALKTRESGDIFSSIEMLEKLIESQPQYKRAQLELAVAYFRATLFSQAKSHAEAVLADPNTPAQVKETVDIFLTQLADIEAAEDENRHTFEGSIGVGIGTDTNVNASPSDTLVDINGIEFTLEPGSIAQESHYGMFNVQVNHTYNIPGTFGIGSRPVKGEWASAARFEKKIYQDVSDYDLDVITATTGLNLISSTNWRAGVNLRMDHISLGGNQLGLFTGLNGSYTVIDGVNEYTITAGATNQDYNSSANEGREGIRYEMGAEMQHQFDDKWMAQVGLNYALTDAKDIDQQHTDKTVNAGVFYSPYTDTLVYGQLSYQDVSYDGIAAIISTSRSDIQKSATIGGTYNFSTGALADWILNAKVSRYDNDSNLNAFDYERTDAMVELSKRF